MTVLELEGPETELELKILSTMSPRERRTWIRSFLNEIKPWLRFFARGAIDHSRDGAIRTTRSLERGLPRLSNSTKNNSSDNQAYSTGIRLRRLKSGLSQAELATKVGIQRTHLSEIETGRCAPRPATRERLERALREHEDEDDP